MSDQSIYIFSNFFAVAYGEGNYSCDQYEDAQGCTNDDTPTPIDRKTTNTSKEVPAAPQTGFFDQPMYILAPSLLGLAIIMASVTYLISRAIARRR